VLPLTTIAKWKQAKSVLNPIMITGLAVRYTLGGTAINGVDYPTLPVQ